MTRFLSFTLLLLSAAAHANQDPCNITKSVTLTANSSAHCIDFRVGPNVVITTGDFKFQRQVDGQSILGEPGKPGKLVGNVEITTFSLGGQLIAEALNSAVNITTSGYNSGYSQNLRAFDNGTVMLKRQGQDVTEAESNFSGI